MPQLDGLEPIPILLQHLEICKMMSHILVNFKKVGPNSDPLVINQPNSKPDGTARLTTFPGRFIVLYVVVDNLLGSTVAPNVPSAFATLTLKTNIYPKIVLEALATPVSPSPSACIPTSCRICSTSWRGRWLTFWSG